MSLPWQSRNVDENVKQNMRRLLDLSGLVQMKYLTSQRFLWWTGIEQCFFSPGPQGILPSMFEVFLLLPGIAERIAGV